MYSNYGHKKYFDFLSISSTFRTFTRTLRRNILCNRFYCLQHMSDRLIKSFYIAILSFLLLTTGDLHAQSGPDDLAYLQSALSAIDVGDYQKAVNILEALVDKNPEEMRYTFYAGYTYMLMDQADHALPLLKKAQENGYDTKAKFYLKWHDWSIDYICKRIDWTLARAYHKTGDYANALVYYRRFEKKFSNNKKFSSFQKNIIRQYIGQAQNGRVLVQLPADTIKVRNLKEINTNGDEYAPFATIYNNEVLYTSHSMKGTYKLIRATADSLTSDSLIKFRPAQFKADIQKGAVPTIVWMGPDNKSLILCLSDGFARKYIEYHNQDSGWVSKGEKEFVNLGGYDISSLHLSLDRKTLLFTALGKENIGGSDIYLAVRKEDGTWSAPANLGNRINTKWDESGPFLDPVTNALYFSTNGRTSIGGFDIFKAEYDTAQKRWLYPMNVGYPINSSGDDMTFYMTTDRKHAYLSSNRKDGKGGLDVYAVDFIQPKATMAMLLGRVLDSITNAPTLSDIHILEKGSMDTIIAHTDRSNGNFTVLLPMNHSYEIEVVAPNYHHKKFEIELRDSEVYFVQEENFYMVPIVRQGKANLANVFFEADRAELLEVSFKGLDEIARVLTDSTNYFAQIAGHTEPGGLEEANKELSRARAQVVVDYLKTKGVPAKRLHAIGCGSRYPITRERDEKARQLNRRTEMIIYNLKSEEFDPNKYLQEVSEDNKETKNEEQKNTPKDK